MARVLCCMTECVNYYTGRIRIPEDSKMHWGVGQCRKDVVTLDVEALPGFPSCTGYEERKENNNG